MTLYLLRRYIVVMGLLAGLAIVAGCRPTPTPVPATPTASPTPTATASPTATATPTPTSTPTPTALPASVSGDPRQASLRTPSPQPGAPCGVVDVLDFPLDPPNAELSVGGTDFGVYRERFNGIHTGEDWWSALRQSSLGKSVYSIGHGVVTYAQPRGWGVDIGTVIIRHVFSDGSTLLSFYGHLDPPSVVLRAGNCVARGQQVGRIGKPSTPPHLHFEIRSHMPGKPGPGYWSVDPALAGWKPPSRTIWNSRVSVLPGVLWSYAFSDSRRRSLGVVNDDTLIVLDGTQLVGVNLANGRARWRQPISDEVHHVILNSDQTLIYTINQFGLIEAYHPPESAPAPSQAAWSPVWTSQLDAIGLPTLLPLPGGGLAVYVYGQMFGVSPDGALLWKLDSTPAPLDWALGQNRLLLITQGKEAPLWAIDEDGPVQWASISGRLAVVGETVFVYARDGLYRLEAETHRPQLVYALPSSRPDLGDIVALPDGGLLVAHSDLADKRLIAFDSDGTLRWQRSYALAVPQQRVRSTPRLVVAGPRVYLLLQNDTTLSSASSAFGTTDMYALDMNSFDLTYLFAGGTRERLPEDTWAFATGDDRLLINFGGGTLVAFSTE